MILDKLIIINDGKFENTCKQLTEFLENEIYSLDDEERSEWNEEKELNFMDFIVGLYLSDFCQNADNFDIQKVKDSHYIIKNNNDEFKIEFKYK